MKKFYSLSLVSSKPFLSRARSLFLSLFLCQLSLVCLCSRARACTHARGSRSTPRRVSQKPRNRRPSPSDRPRESLAEGKDRPTFPSPLSEPTLRKKKGVGKQARQPTGPSESRNASRRRGKKKNKAKARRGDLELREDPKQAVKVTAVKRTRGGEKKTVFFSFFALLLASLIHPARNNIVVVHRRR